MKTELKIYDTLSRSLQPFKPIDPRGKDVLLYQCGPTVYWTQHIGNMRAMVMADLVYRTLNTFGYTVRFARNYTDVGHLTSDQDEGEDKMEKGARREGRSPSEIAEAYIEIFEQDIALLNTCAPDYKPKATEYVAQMIEMVQLLLEKGFAYATPKAIYFDISKKSDYNKLNKQKLEFNRVGAGAGDVSDPDKKNPQDFSLWFFKTGAHKKALQVWESPFTSPEVENGVGFPGWHIECSAMIKSLLGDTIDIHMGGIEHISVHHTNEIAQSESANEKPFVKYWMHYEHLNVDGGKMSKSDGTGYLLSELVDKGYDPLDLRYFFLGAHYRSKQNFTWEALDGAKSARLNLVEKLAALQSGLDSNAGEISSEFIGRFHEVLAEDFNVPSGVALLWELLKSDLRAADKYVTVLEFDKVLGLKVEESLRKFSEGADVIPVEVKLLLEQRQKARAQKNFAESDRLRAEIAKLGFEVMDGAGSQRVKLIR